MEPSPILLRPIIGLLYLPCKIDNSDCGVIGEMNDWQRKLKYSEESHLSGTVSSTNPI
jgi:hypothetical protein